jgi:hypothetical protein
VLRDFILNQMAPVAITILLGEATCLQAINFFGLLYKNISV